MKILKKIFIISLIMVSIFTCFYNANAVQTGDVASAIEGTWTAAVVQIKSVVNKVVFPAIDLVLVVCFFAKLSMAYFDYKRHGNFEWTGPAILFVCLIFTLTAPLYIWTIVGV